MNIDLSKAIELPDKFVANLKSINHLCHEYEFSEQLVEHPKVLPIVQDIDDYCRSHKVVGIHYTRAEIEKIREGGLLVRFGKEIREQFLKDYGHLFSDSELEYIKEKWLNYFDAQQSKGRDNRIFFNFTCEALKQGGAANLLGMYGGEQVNMCFRFDSNIGKKLRQIGSPILVKCSLDPDQINTFIEHPWGKILVSSYHLSQNSEAYRIDQDGYSTLPIEPNQIIELKILSNNDF